MSKQTAIEWLTDQLGIDGGTLREKALAKGREQMLELISFVRVHNKMGKTAEDLLEQFEAYKGGDK